MLVDPATTRSNLTPAAVRPVAAAGITPAKAAVATGMGAGSRKGARYVARLPIRAKKLPLDQPPGAGAQPLNFWHVWLADGLVPDATAPAADFAGMFDRAAAIAAERAAAYRANTLEDDAPPADLPRFDLRA